MQTATLLQFAVSIWAERSTDLNGPTEDDDDGDDGDDKVDFNKLYGLLLFGII